MIMMAVKAQKKGEPLCIQPASTISVCNRVRRQFFSPPTPRKDNVKTSCAPPPSPTAASQRKGEGQKEMRFEKTTSWWGENKKSRAILVCPRCLKWHVAQRERKKERAAAAKKGDRWSSNMMNGGMAWEIERDVEIAAPTRSLIKKQHAEI